MTVNCQKISDNMLDYIEGVIGEKEKEELHKHIDECHVCREEFYKLKEIIHHVKSVPLPENKCPEPDLLVRFTENDVTFSEGKEIKSHLENCFHCREEVTLLFELNQEISLKPDTEIYEKKVMPPSFMSYIGETYSRKVPVISAPKPGLLDIVSGLFRNRRLINVMATCSVAIFMALNGILQFSPGFFSGNLKINAPSVSFNSPSYDSEQLKEKKSLSLSEKSEGRADIQSKDIVAPQAPSVANTDGISQNTANLPVHSKILQEEKEKLPEKIEKEISQIAGVSNARIQFDGNIATVYLYTNQNYSLTSTQINSIIASVASSKGISMNRVKVYDSRGLALSDNVLSSQKEQYANLTYKQRLEQHDFEEVLTQNIQNTIDRKLGPGNSIVQVGSNIDFVVDEPIIIPGGRTIAGETAYQETSGGNKVADNNIASSYGNRDKLEKVNNKDNRNFTVAVYPPGFVKAINIYVALNNNVDYDKKELEKIISSSVGAESNRNENIRIEKQNINTETPVYSVENTEITPLKTDVKSGSNIIGIISFVFAGAFLIVSVNSIIRGK